MGNVAPSWKQWLTDFIHGRTHVAYGLIASTISSSYGVMIAPYSLRVPFLVCLIGSLGALIDTVAHLYYH